MLLHEPDVCPYIRLQSSSVMTLCCHLLVNTGKRSRKSLFAVGYGWNHRCLLSPLSRFFFFFNSLIVCGNVTNMNLLHFSLQGQYGNYQQWEWVTAWLQHQQSSGLAQRWPLVSRWVGLTDSCSSLRSSQTQKYLNAEHSLPSLRALT